LERVGKSPGVWDPDKLRWLNAHYLREGRVEEVARMLIPFLQREGIDPPWDERLMKVVRSLQPRSQTLQEMAKGALFYFRRPQRYEEGTERYLISEIVPFLETFIERLRDTPFYPEALEGVFREVVNSLGVKSKVAAQAIRAALTGRTVSPGLFEVMDALGKEEVLERLHRAIEYIRGAPSGSMAKDAT